MSHRFEPVCLLMTALLAAACGRASQPPAASHPRVDVVELGATQALRLMADGKLTSRELTQAYLDRIAADRRCGAGAATRCSSSIPRALADAEALDAERKAGKLRARCTACPVLIKDNVDVAGLVNSAGSLALADHRPKQDAFLVTRPARAGAVILARRT
jgi:amidase